MVEGRRRTDIPWSLNARAAAAMTGTSALSAGGRQRSRRRLLFGQSGQRRIERRDETSISVVAVVPNYLYGMGTAPCLGFYSSTSDRQPATAVEPMFENLGNQIKIGQSHGSPPSRNIEFLP